MANRPPKGLQAALMDSGTGASILLNKQCQPCIVFKLPEDIMFDAATPIGVGHMEFYEYVPEGVVIRFLFEIYQDLAHLEPPLKVLDSFLDPTDESGKLLLEKLANCDGVEVHAWWNDADLTYCGGKTIRWPEQHRQSVRRLQLESAGKATRWPEAKIRCMRENPLE